jgi:hypothetical protein
MTGDGERCASLCVTFNNTQKPHEKRTSTPAIVCREVTKISTFCARLLPSFYMRGLFSMDGVNMPTLP